MGEKISEEMAKKIIDVLFKYTQHKKDAMFELRAAGLLEPEETELEKAREAWKAVAGYLVRLSDKRIYHELKTMGEEYESAITRLKASAWTREDMGWAFTQGNTRAVNWKQFDIMLAQRKAGKGAE